MVDVALLTDARYVNPPNPGWYAQQILDEDKMLAAELSQLGLTSIRLDWADPDFDWSTARCIVFRTTWDYFNRIDEFRTWLARVEQQTRLINAPSLIHWNLDKHYLLDLQAKGVNIPPTLIIKKGDLRPLRVIMDTAGWNEAVLKPTISGAGQHTYRLSSANAEEYEEVFRELLLTEDMMVQAFLPSIVTRGEVALMVFDGQFSHAVIKTAKAGDFRVQDDFGGTTRPYNANAEEIHFAETVMRHCDPIPMYGRVDIMWDTNGQPAVSEVELIEPELWMRHHPPAAQLFAKALNRALNG